MIRDCVAIAAERVGMSAMFSEDVALLLIAWSRAQPAVPPVLTQHSTAAFIELVARVRACGVDGGLPHDDAP